MTNGWGESAQAWIADMERGDFSREFVLDAPMLQRIRERTFERALDVGCGEGRFCRMVHDLGIAVIGVDPTHALIERARELDPAGDYREGRAEALAFPANSFDLVISYLTLIDIDDADAGIAEMARVLRPGGTLLIANLASSSTAEGAYFDERAQWVEWRGIHIRNWHRPLSRYVESCLAHGLQLRHLLEPEPTGGDSAKIEHYRRAPWLCIMEWTGLADCRESAQ